MSVVQSHNCRQYICNLEMFVLGRLCYTNVGNPCKFLFVSGHKFGVTFSRCFLKFTWIPDSGQHWEPAKLFYLPKFSFVARGTTAVRVQITPPPPLHMLDEKILQNLAKKKIKNEDIRFPPPREYLRKAVTYVRHFF